MNETSNGFYNEELKQLAEDLFSAIEQTVEAFKNFCRELKEVLSNIMTPLIEYNQEIERRRHNNHTRQSWVVNYDTSRASQVVYRKPRFTRKII